MIKKADKVSKNFEKVYFISDLHLGSGPEESDKMRETLLVGFIASIPAGSSLVIVGDLFDYWFEFRQVYQRGFFRTLSALYELTARGVEVHYLIGNHDFFHRDFFSKELGVNLIEDHLIIENGTSRVFAAHGDGYVKNDHGYRVLKAVLRNKTIQFLYGLIHPDLGLWIARSTSKGSRHYTGQKDYGKIDGLVEAAEQKMKEGYDFVIFGHSHKRKFVECGDGFYANLGSWLDKPCYGVLENNDFKITDLN